MTEEEEIEKEFDELTPEGKKIVTDEIQRTFSADKIGNIHEFLQKVIEEEDNTKIGNLSPEELGNPHLTFRGYKELAILSDTFEMPGFSEYFDRFANMVSGSSLSKNGFLILAAITERKKMEAKLPGQRKENKGWFGSRNKSQPISEY